MPTDRHIEGPSRTCAVSNREFAPGDTVSSYLLDDVEQYVRVDMLAECAAAYTPPRLVVCRWNWTVKPRREDAEREQARSTLEQMEAMFLALCDGEPVSEGLDETERDALRHMLSLALLRKRILRQQEGDQMLHPASGRTFNVPVPKTLNPQTLAKISALLGNTNG